MEQIRIKTKSEKLEQARFRREVIKEPRDWAELWWAYFLHGVQGALAGGLGVLSVLKSSVTLAVFAFTMTTMYVAYQGLSFARKHDTVGRDLTDYAVGWGFGALLLYLYFQMF